MRLQKQNEISHIYLMGSDLRKREEQVLKDAVQKTGFQPKKIISRSSWWGSKEIGAFFVTGNYRGSKAVLKIQGVKPTVSEVYMIKAFQKANRSKLIRPPELFSFLPWDKHERYEALILESVEKRIMGIPTNQEELNNFFNVYVDYNKNCLNNPWLNKPTESISERIENNFKIWRKASLLLYPKHPFRKKKDKELIDQAVKILKKEYEGVDFKFQHGHFSQGDLYEKGGQIVLLSNLYWGWKPPLYDAVFGQHWFIYHLADTKNATIENIDQQKKLWFEKIKSLPNVKSSSEKLLKLALLERATAGLNLDSLTVNRKRKTAKHVVELARKDVMQLTEELK